MKSCREKAGLSREQVSLALDISKDAIKKWEIGKSMPVASKLPDIAKLYGCTIDDLFKEEQRNV